jgi:hypothetical protein
MKRLLVLALLLASAASAQDNMVRIQVQVYDSAAGTWVRRTLTLGSGFTLSEADSAIKPDTISAAAGSGDMAKSVYDTDGNGVVDSSEAAPGGSGVADTLNGDDYVTRVEGVESGTGQEKYLLGGSGGFAAVDKVTFRGSFITIATGSGNPYTVSVSGVGVIYVTVHYSITSDDDGSMTVDIKFDGSAAAVPQTFAGLKTHPTASAMTAVISYDNPATPDLELVGSTGVTITDVQWSVLIFPTEP